MLWTLNPCKLCLQCVRCCFHHQSVFEIKLAITSMHGCETLLYTWVSQQGKGAWIKPLMRPVWLQLVCWHIIWGQPSWNDFDFTAVSKVCMRLRVLEQYHHYSQATEAITMYWAVKGKPLFMDVAHLFT